MSQIKVNFKNSKIEVSESFAKKASIYDSTAHHELMKVQNAHPTFAISVLKAKSRKSSSIKGITREFMYNYAMNHAVDNSIEEFEKLKAENASYLAVKTTFLKTYPEFKNYKTKTEWILAA
ncbi:MAG: hypothetical protein E7353_09260 [Clostridiales bacterium]|nr:hypothetical protein [Clostridiales bacterium]